MSALPFKRTSGRIEFNPGRMSVWSGTAGHGKSLLLGQVILGFLDQDEKVFLASLKDSSSDALKKIFRQAIGKRKTDQNELQALQMTLAGNLYITDKKTSQTAGKVVSAALRAVKLLGVKHVVIDYLECLGSDEENQWAISELKSMAKEFGIHVHLVMQPAAPAKEYTIPTNDDIRRNGEIIDQADNVLVVWRNLHKEKDLAEGKPTFAHDPDALLLCDKSSTGWHGITTLWLDKESLRFADNLLGIV